MEISEVIGFTSQALLLVLVLSLPPIIAAAVVGTMVALLQALTQVQEQTLSFAIKLLVVILVILGTAAWLGGELFNFSSRIFKIIAEI